MTSNKFTASNGLGVIQEDTGAVYLVLSERSRDITTYLTGKEVEALKEYFAHTERPWEQAEPNSVWALTLRGLNEPALFEAQDSGHGKEFYGLQSDDILDLDYDKITSGIQIWPKEES